MVFDTYHIIYLLANFFLIFVVHRFMRVFFEHRKYKRILGILAYSFYFIMTTLVYLLIDIPLITLSFGCHKPCQSVIAVFHTL